MKKNLMKLITLALAFMLLAAVPGKPAEATFTFGSASSQEKTVREGSLEKISGEEPYMYRSASVSAGFSSFVLTTRRSSRTCSALSRKRLSPVSATVLAGLR